jgi:transcriptional regulator with XRE-family HTH domain
MTIVEITGGMLRAARSLTGLSQQELAERTGLCRHQFAMGGMDLAARVRHVRRISREA